MWTQRFVAVAAGVAIACVAAEAQSGDVLTTGRAITTTGVGIPRATVTYMNLAKRFSWDFADAQGYFGHSPTGVIPSVAPGIRQTTVVTAAGAMLTLSLAASNRVSIELFDLNGKKIANLYDQKLEKGEYTIRPLASLSGARAKSMCLLKISVGKEVVYQKAFDAQLIGNTAAAGSVVSKEPVVAMRKAVLLAVDTVRVGMTGYTPVKIPITRYDTAIGNVTLAAINIDSLVNAKFAQMNQLQKCGQLAMPPYPIAAGTLASNFCGGAFGGGGCFSGYTPTTTANLHDGYQNALMGTTLRIPAICAYDAVHGASAVPSAVIMPHNMGMGAIQDTVLIQKGFRVAALEVRGTGANWGFGPCIAVIRDDRWGRAYEGFCETPERTQLMARHAVLGIQLTDLSFPMTYAACVKHFAGDGNTLGGANPGTTEGPDATARAINLPGYVSAVAVGAATVMPSFSSWCVGGQMHRNKTLLTGWLKTATGPPTTTPFMGFVVGDWEAGWPLPASADAGLDMPMAPGTGVGIISTNDVANNNNFNSIYNLGGTYPARLDDAVRRVLRVKAWMNLFSQDQYVTNRNLTALVGCALHRDVARACVRGSLVLLKNNMVGGVPVLPMPKNSTVAVWGTGGNDVGIQCGGWCVSWQGSVGNPTSGGTTIYQGMQALATGGTVTFVASPAAAGATNYVVAVFSENPYAEQGGLSIALSGGPNTSGTNGAVITQIAAAHTAGKRVIGILMAGRPLDISGVLANCDAFIWASLPGTEGRGIGEMLYSDQGYKFTGKLQVTWPNNVNDEPINVGDGKTGLFAYGFGLTD